MAVIFSGLHQVSQCFSEPIATVADRQGMQLIGRTCLPPASGDTISRLFACESSLELIRGDQHFHDLRWFLLGEFTPVRLEDRSRYAL